MVWQSKPGFSLFHAPTVCVHAHKPWLMFGGSFVPSYESIKPVAIISHLLLQWYCCNAVKVIKTILIRRIRHFVFRRKPLCTICVLFGWWFVCRLASNQIFSLHLFSICSKLIIIGCATWNILTHTNICFIQSQMLTTLSLALMEYNEHQNDPPKMGSHLGSITVKPNTVVSFRLWRIIRSREIKTN